jgi:murein L,D-transpeptidase YafK
MPGTGPFLAIALIACFTSASADGLDRAPVPVTDTSVGRYSLEIDKSARQLLLKDGTRIARRYTVAVGRGGRGDKRIRGDNKTPIGVYHITGFNESSPFDLFMRLNYPNLKDGYFGLRRSLITRTQFDRIVDAQQQDELPPQDTPLGGAIGIHGLGEETAERLRIQANADWTQGCIALTNREVHELRRYVDVGTRVEIHE